MKGRLNSKAVQMSGLVDGEEVDVMKSAWGSASRPEEADWTNINLCRPFRDSILVLAYPALPCRALDSSVPTGLASWRLERSNKKGRRGVSAKRPLFSLRLSFLVRLSILDSFIVQVVLRGTVVGPADHRLHTDILHLRDQT
jgi:hypothetical protein